MSDHHVLAGFYGGLVLDDLLSWLSGAVAEALQLTDGAVDPGSTLVELGSTSMQAIALQYQILQRTGKDVAIDDLLGGRTLTDLAELLAKPEEGEPADGKGMGCSAYEGGRSTFMSATSHAPCEMYTTLSLPTRTELGLAPGEYVKLGVVLPGAYTPTVLPPAFVTYRLPCASTVKPSGVWSPLVMVPIGAGSSTSAG